MNAASVLRLRSWLDKLANVPGFMNEEKGKWASKQTKILI